MVQYTRSGHGSSGRAPALGAGGSRFKSGCPDKGFYMSQQRSCIFNILHTAADQAEESAADGIQTVTSRIFKTPFPFSSFVLSAGFRAPADGWLLLETQVYEKGRWSGFYKLGLLSGKMKSSFPAQEDSFGRVAADELLLSAPAEAYRYRLKLFGGAEVTVLAATGVSASFIYDEKNASRLPPGSFAHAVEPISQMEQNHPDRRRICSPTSLCMALNALGFKTDLKDLLNEVFDQTAGIFGNWVFNVAAASARGAAAYVRRFNVLTELKDFVTENSLVVASIGYNKGELAQAAIEHTPGHLVLVRGWQDGKILVADPAALTKDLVLRAYDAREFAKAWLFNKKGAAYVVRKK